MPDLLVPLKHAELLYVALAVVADELEARTNYPVDNLRLALRAYENGRNEYLYSRGWKDEQRLEITAAATEALTAWIDERSMRHAEPDFDAWRQELEDNE